MTKHVHLIVIPEEKAHARAIGEAQRRFSPWKEFLREEDARVKKDLRRARKAGRPRVGHESIRLNEKKTCAICRGGNRAGNHMIPSNKWMYPPIFGE